MSIYRQHSQLTLNSERITKFNMDLRGNKPKLEVAFQVHIHPSATLL